MNHFSGQVLKTETTIKIQPIRLNWHYVLWYQNVTVLIGSLIVPLILLAYWNFHTLSVMRRRHRLRNRPSVSADLHLNVRDGLLSADTPTNLSESTALATIESFNAGTITPISRRESRSDESKLYIIYMYMNSDQHLSFQGLCRH